MNDDFIKIRIKIKLSQFLKTIDLCILFILAIRSGEYNIWCVKTSFILEFWREESARLMDVKRLFKDKITIFEIGEENSLKNAWRSYFHGHFSIYVKRSDRALLIFVLLSIIYLSFVFVHIYKIKISCAIRCMSVFVCMCEWAQ